MSVWVRSLSCLTSDLNERGPALLHFPFHQSHTNKPVHARATRPASHWFPFPHPRCVENHNEVRESQRWSPELLEVLLPPARGQPYRSHSGFPELHPRVLPLGGVILPSGWNKSCFTPLFYSYLMLTVCACVCVLCVAVRMSVCTESVGVMECECVCERERVWAQA